MIKVTYICDKCSHEEGKENSNDTFLHGIPKSWSGPSIQVTQCRKKEYLLCPACSDALGFNGDYAVGETVTDKDNAADKLIDMIFELAEERGLINNGE